MLYFTQEKVRDSIDTLPNRTDTCRTDTNQNAWQNSDLAVGAANVTQPFNHIVKISGFNEENFILKLF